jgi:predicted PurR-regulated permease PerM
MLSPSTASPKWSSTAKLTVGLTTAGLFVISLIYFRSLIGPLLLAFILTYLFHPLAGRLSGVTRLSWRIAVTIIYLLFLVLLIGLFTWAGLAVVQQFQNLYKVVEAFVNDIPNLLRTLSAQVYIIGPFRLEVGQYINSDLLAQQLLNVLQPLLREVGVLISALATTALSMVGWLLFVWLISYFLLSDAGRFPDAADYLRIPGYDTDIRRIGQEMGRIWNAFLRGQLIISLLIVISYTILLSSLGVRYAFAIALMAGFARFIPYLGPFVTWTIAALVSIFQASNYFGLEPIKYAVAVVICCLVMDQIFDNFVSPQIMGQTLSVHPAAVLLAALIAANLIGIVGLILAAPVLASLKLFGRYTLRKMLDLDPWEGMEAEWRSMDGNRLNRWAGYLRTRTANWYQRKNK